MEPDHPWQQFLNEPDTDFSLEQNGFGRAELVERWKRESAENPIDIPLTMAGEAVTGRTSRSWTASIRHDREWWWDVTARRRSEDMERAVACARADEQGWRTMDMDQRAAILRKAAQELRRHSRGSDGRRLGRRRQDPNRVRSRSFRSGRLRRVLQPHGGLFPPIAGDQRGTARRRRGGLAVEFSHRDSLRRRRRRSGRG